MRGVREHTNTRGNARNKREEEKEEEGGEGRGGGVEKKKTKNKTEREKRYARSKERETGKISPPPKCAWEKREIEGKGSVEATNQFQWVWLTKDSTQVHIHRRAPTETHLRPLLGAIKEGSFDHLL